MHNIIQVRRTAAEQLYLGLLALDSDAEEAAAAASEAAEPGSSTCAAADLVVVSDGVCEVLLATVWDGDLEAAKAAREQVSLLLEVPMPKMKAPAAAAAKAAPRDEFNSYQALLDDFARGY